jgi:hypothetical protein
MLAYGQNRIGLRSKPEFRGVFAQTKMGTVTAQRDGPLECILKLFDTSLYTQWKFCFWGDAEDLVCSGPSLLEFCTALERISSLCINSSALSAIP